MRSNSQKLNENKNKNSYKVLANDLGFNVGKSNIASQYGNKKNQDTISTLNDKNNSKLNSNQFQSRNPSQQNKIQSSNQNLKKAGVNLNNVNVIQLQSPNINQKNILNNKNLNINSNNIKIVNNRNLVKNSQNLFNANNKNLNLNQPVKINYDNQIGKNNKNKIIPDGKQTTINSSDKFSMRGSNSNIVKNNTKQSKPSDKYTKIKSSDPFAAGKKHKTNFGYVYSAGGIPCRIQHGSIKMKLKWDVEPESKTKFKIILLIK